MIAAANIVVTGLVQGVGFRFFVYRHASRLGIKGYVQNLYNGEVEIEAEGEKDVLEVLIREVRVGPRAADVTDLRVTWKEPRHVFHSFFVR
jgi:acylphosphatase